MESYIKTIFPKADNIDLAKLIIVLQTGQTEHKEKFSYTSYEEFKYYTYQLGSENSFIETDSYWVRDDCSHTHFTYTIKPKKNIKKAKTYEN